MTATEMTDMQTKALAAFLKHGVDMPEALAEYLNDFQKGQFKELRRQRVHTQLNNQGVMYDEPIVELPSDTVPRFESERVDLLDQLAGAITDGTKLPFNFAREIYKQLFLAALPETRPVLPWFHTLHTRQYVILVSEISNDGKGETFRRCQRTLERAAEDDGLPCPLEFISGPSIGGPQWACVALGGERESKKAPEPKPKKLEVNITPVTGQIIHYDEGADATRGNKPCVVDSSDRLPALTSGSARKSSI